MKLKLIIEVDGKIHDLQQDKDRERDAKLLSKGIKVIRIKNDALADMNSRTDLIASIITHRKTEIEGSNHSL